MRGHAKKREMVGNVEFTTDGERLTLRYTRQFNRRTALILLLITLLAGAVLNYPVMMNSRGNPDHETRRRRTLLPWTPPRAGHACSAGKPAPMR